MKECTVSAEMFLVQWWGCYTQGVLFPFLPQPQSLRYGVPYSSDREGSKATHYSQCGPVKWDGQELGVGGVRTCECMHVRKRPCSGVVIFHLRAVSSTLRYCPSTYSRTALQHYPPEKNLVQPGELWQRSSPLHFTLIVSKVLPPTPLPVPCLLPLFTPESLPFAHPAS